MTKCQECEELAVAECEIGFRSLRVKIPFCEKHLKEWVEKQERFREVQGMGRETGVFSFKKFRLIVCWLVKHEGETKEMKAGDIITIYEDPMTCQRIEGNARLVEKQPSDNPPFELWLVDFGDVKVLRWIKSKESDV